MYYAGAGWTGSGNFATDSDWKAYLGHFSRRLQTPLKCSMLPKQ